MLTGKQGAVPGQAVLVRQVYAKKAAVAGARRSARRSRGVAAWLAGVRGACFPRVALELQVVGMKLGVTDPALRGIQRLCWFVVDGSG